MSQPTNLLSTNSHSITPQQLQRLATGEAAIIDIRKDAARNRSGITMAGCSHRRPFSADCWWRDHVGQRVVVFCVHGHEVSQAVSGFLRDQGIDCRYLEGGFEAWIDAGGATIPIGGDQ